MEPACGDFRAQLFGGGVLYTASECDDDWLSGCEPGAGPVYVRTRKKLGFHYLQWKHLDDGICQGRRSTVPKRDISANLQTFTAYAPPRWKLLHPLASNSHVPIDRECPAC
jgi:hypothetical protein